MKSRDEVIVVQKTSGETIGTKQLAVKSEHPQLNKQRLKAAVGSWQIMHCQPIHQKKDRSCLRHFLQQA